MVAGLWAAMVAGTVAGRLPMVAALFFNGCRKVAVCGTRLGNTMVAGTVAGGVGNHGGNRGQTAFAAL